MVTYDSRLTTDDVGKTNDGQLTFDGTTGQGSVTMKTTIGMRHEAGSGSFASITIVVAIAVLALRSLAFAGDAQQALTWLEAQQRPDGSWCMASQQPEANGQQQACAAYTAEVLQAISQQPTAISSGAAAKGIQYMENVVPHDTRVLARKLLVGKMAGYVKSEDVEKLKALVTSEGGFGAWRSYKSASAYRTIPALQFLAGYDLTLAARAAHYLASLQNLDGSFSPAGDVATTAEFIIAISHQLSAVSQDVDIQAAVTRGLDFIVSNANADGADFVPGTMPGRTASRDPLALGG
jgi:prenyltransferase beta subunit